MDPMGLGLIWIKGYGLIGIDMKWFTWIDREFSYELMCTFWLTSLDMSFIHTTFNSSLLLQNAVNGDALRKTNSQNPENGRQRKTILSFWGKFRLFSGANCSGPGSVFYGDFGSKTVPFFAQCPPRRHLRYDEQPLAKGPNFGRQRVLLD